MSILITGSNGLVGQAFRNYLQELKLQSLYYCPTSGEVDLTDYQQTYRYFKQIKPEIVVHLAANVGGLFKNMNFKAEMFDKNLLMNFNVLKASHEVGVKKVISCLSTCIFPDKTTYPINEKMLHDGPPHFSNDAYAYAKRMLDVQSRAYYEQYGDKFISIIPTNIYGEHDNYHLENAHVIPALIHKCYLAKQENKIFQVMGTGKPLRQFIYAKDLAKLIYWVLKNYDEIEPLILSVPEKDEVSIGTVATRIAQEFGMENQMEFVGGEDGQYQKTADNSKLMGLIGEFEFTPIEEGIKNSVRWFEENYENCRK